MVAAQTDVMIDFCEDMAFLKHYPEQTVICHLFSSYGIQDKEEFSILLKKAAYAHQIYTADCRGEPAMAVFPSVSDYREFVRECEADPGLMRRRLSEETILSSEAFMDLSDRNEFLRFITSGFEARFFNALQGDEYTVTKRSTNKAKIKSEYTFYHLLPEAMKIWFVMPIHYCEDAETASYTMERLHVTDLAVRYVHGAIDLQEMTEIFEKLFHFLALRERRTVTKEAYAQLCEKLYVTKVEERIAQLGEHEGFRRLDGWVASGTAFNGIDDIVRKYKKLYYDLTKSVKFKAELAIGHGDLCFSNILYQRDAGLLKLIDPKGCRQEKELYTDPYYDLAKLSHSVCGNYDFFNSGLYQVVLGEDMKFHLSVDTDNEAYRKLFQEFLERAGYDYRIVRLYEASLFLSMLPLHMDREQKVFALLQNAVSIMEQL